MYLRAGKDMSASVSYAKHMNRLLLSALVCSAALGCAPQPDAQTPARGPAPPVQANPAAPGLNSPASGSSSGGIAPIGPNAGGITPVAGTDSVEGAGGGGVDQAAKNAAKKAASQSTPNLGDDGQ